MIPAAEGGFAVVQPEAGLLLLVAMAGVAAGGEERLDVAGKVGGDSAGAEEQRREGGKGGAYGRGRLVRKSLARFHADGSAGHEKTPGHGAGR